MTHNSNTASRILRLVVACVAITVLMASCGDDDDSPSADGSATTEATTTTQSVCDDREALQSSVDALKAVDVRAEGSNGVKTAVGAVEDDLAGLREAADAEIKPQIDAVQDALDELGPAVEDIDSGGAAEAATAVANVATAAASLIGSLESAQCE